jgi:hypothetical protein
MHTIDVNPIPFCAKKKKERETQGRPKLVKDTQKERE